MYYLDDDNTLYDMLNMYVEGYFLLHIQHVLSGFNKLLTVIKNIDTHTTANIQLK